MGGAESSTPISPPAAGIKTADTFCATRPLLACLERGTDMLEPMNLSNLSFGWVLSVMMSSCALAI